MNIYECHFLASWRVYQRVGEFGSEWGVNNSLLNSTIGDH